MTDYKQLYEELKLKYDNLIVIHTQNIIKLAEYEENINKTKIKSSINQKKFYEKHKEEIIEKNKEAYKEYYENHKEEIIEKTKEYRKNLSAEKIKEYNKRYYEKKKYIRIFS